MNGRNKIYSTFFFLQQHTITKMSWKIVENIPITFRLLSAKKFPCLTIFQPHIFFLSLFTFSWWQGAKTSVNSLMPKKKEKTSKNSTRKKKEKENKRTTLYLVLILLNEIPSKHPKPYQYWNQKTDSQQSVN